MLQRRERWMYELIQKMLEGDGHASKDKQPWLALLDPASADLLVQTEFKYAKVDMYRYEMASSLWNIAVKWIHGEEVIWWNRNFEEALIRPVQMQSSGSLAYADL